MERSESIGEVGWSDGRNSDFAYEWAKEFLLFALGDPPIGVRVDVQSHDHDLGSYSTLAVFWQEGYPEPWKFIRRAEDALSIFNDAVDWSCLDPSNFIDEED